MTLVTVSFKTSREGLKIGRNIGGELENELYYKR
jgi:hypothetical protein